MDAGRLYEIAMGAIMVVGGTMLVCFAFGLFPRGWKIREAGDSIALKRTHPLLFSMLGPTLVALGVAQILRQLGIL